jgi:predicted dienelactone hydrolase
VRRFGALFLVLAWFGLAAPAASAAGFQYGTAPDPDDQPIELGIWYPSDAAVSPQALGLFTQDVAPYGAVAGQGLPLIVISHGTGGGAASHYDTAVALANAGFVVVAPSHTGDNYKDHAYAFSRRNFTGRPNQISRVIDFMLNGWDAHDRLDPARIGIFGHSAGGATALILLGGNPDLSLAVLFCRDHPDAWDCQRLKERTDAGGDAATITAELDKKPDWHHDPRIKAAAIAAPAIGYTFTKDGLSAVTAPIQLWRAEDDKIAANEWNGDIVKAALPIPPDDHLVPNAGHFSFLAPCSDALAKVAPDICQDPAGFDRAAFHRQFNQALAEFFKARLAP